MTEKRFTYTTRIIADKKGYCKDYIWDNETLLNTEQIVRILNAQDDYIDYVTKERNLAYNKLDKLNDENKTLKKVNEDLREVNKENQLLHEENVKQCERWKNLYELKDAEVTARVDALNRVCNYYLTETQFKAETDPNDAVKEVINEILNAPIYEE